MSDTPQLTIMLQGQTIQTLDLRSGSLSIGRTPDNDVALPHPLVARRHAELRLEDGTLQITDLESASGTFLAGARLLAGQPSTVAPGGVVQIGPFALIYQAVAAPADAAPGEPQANLKLPRARPSTPVAPSDEPRPTFPVGRPLGPYSRYLEFLPMVFHQSDFIGRFLMIEESIWEPLQQRQDHLDMYFDPRTAPESQLSWLASWLDIALDPNWPEARRRRVAREAMDLYRWRGTRYGISRMIELCTGISPEITDEPNRPWVIRVRLRLAAAAGVDREDIIALIEANKPAHVGYILEVRP